MLLSLLLKSEVLNLLASTGPPDFSKLDDEEDEDESKWLRECQVRFGGCGEKTYLRKGLCANPACRMYYMWQPGMERARKRGEDLFDCFFCFFCFFSFASLRSCRLCTAPNYRSLAESGKRRSLTNSFQWCKLKRRKSKLIINQQVGEHKIQTAKTIHSIIVGLRVSGVGFRVLCLVFRFNV